MEKENREKEKKDPMEEFIDIYDKDQNRLGLTVSREGAFMKEGQFMLYVLAIVQDKQGRFLITRRSLDKHWAAGWWEVSGGGVRSGETPAQAVIREVGEEVGLAVPDENPLPIYTYENVDLERGDNYIVNMYRFTIDFTIDDVVLQEEEAVDCRLATWDEISKLNEQGIFLHYGRVKTALGA